MLASNIVYQESIQDIILDIYNNADYNFSLRRWPFPDIYFSTIFNKLREKSYFSAITEQQLKAELQKIRYLYEIEPNLFRLFIQLDDICSISTNIHIQNCFKLHWINNNMLCKKGLDLRTYGCIESDCQLLHIHKQYLFDRIISLFLYIYHEFNNNLKFKSPWNLFDVSIHTFKFYWQRIFKYFPIPINNYTNDIKIWRQILTTYNKYFDPLKKTEQDVWILDDHKIKFIFTENEILSIICSNNFFNNKCNNIIYHPYIANKILHPLMCNQIHISFCIKKQFSEQIKKIKFHNLIYINLHNGLYRLHNDMMIEKNGLQDKFKLLSRDPNLISHQIIKFNNNDFNLNFYFCSTFQLDDKIDNGWHNPQNHNLISQQVIIKTSNVISNINSMLKKISLLLTYDLEISNIQKNIVLKFIIDKYPKFIQEFINLFRLINARYCFGRRKTIYINNEINDDKDILIVEIKDVNLLINSDHIKNWFHKLIAIYEFEKYGKTELNNYMHYLESLTFYTQTVDTEYSVIKIKLFQNDIFNNLYLFDHCNALNIKISPSDPNENGRFIQHIIPLCYYSFGISSSSYNNANKNSLNTSPICLNSVNQSIKNLSFTTKNKQFNDNSGKYYNNMHLYDEEKTINQINNHHLQNKQNQFTNYDNNKNNITLLKNSNMKKNKFNKIVKNNSNHGNVQNNLNQNNIKINNEIVNTNESVFSYKSDWSDW